MIKIFFLILAGTIMGMTSINAQITVSEPMIVADQDTYGNVRPRIALNAANEPVITWCSSSEEKLYVSKMDNGSFTIPEQLNPDGFGISSFDWYGPDIASSGNNIVVVFKLEPEDSQHIYVVMSPDGGETWGDTVLVENSVPMMSRMPSVGMDESGNPLVTFLREDMMGFSEWTMAKSIDSGESFLPPVSTSINFTDEVCDCCPSETLIDNGRVITIYRNNENNLRDIRASISIDNAETFPIQADLDDLDWVINACPSSGPAGYVASDILNTAWMSNASGDTRVYYSSYDLQSGEIVQSIPAYPDESNVVQNFPSIAGNGNIKAIVYEILQNGQRDIQVAYNLNSGWTNVSLINLTTEMEGNQLRPDIAYADGVFHLVYTDNGGDAVIYQSITGFVSNSEITAPKDLLIYPNPGTDWINIDAETSSIQNEDRILIQDVLGNTVECTEFVIGHQSIRLNISNLKSGSYFIRSESPGSEKYLGSFIKNN